MTPFGQSGASDALAAGSVGQPGPMRSTRTRVACA